MTNQLLVNLVNSVLGTGKQTARSNYAYHCPFCHHHKPKLEVQLIENKEGNNPWNCWTCGTRGKTLYSLFKRMKTSADKIAEAKRLIKSSKSIKDIEIDNSVSLPKEYISFDKADKNRIYYRHALAYLKKRGLSLADIYKYQIGYCEGGKYDKMVIIPSYDAEGSLNYFVARSFDANAFKKYSNPPVSRDVVPTENLINWNLPIILCEGMFDAIAIKRNAIPLLGKNIQTQLMKRIISSQVEKIYIALDKDAQKQSIKFCEQFMNEGKEVYLVDLEEKDPSDLGFSRFTKLIQNTEPLNYLSLMQYKLEL